MKLRTAYLVVARRSLEASKTLLDKNVHESAAFYAYHAFESTGGSLCEACGKTYHPASHPQKITRFKIAAQSSGLGMDVAKAAIILASVRNGCLYPSVSKGVISTPDKHISPSAAKDMLKIVKAIYEKVRLII